jgi:superoxide dismutase, Fe-Mn family
MSNKIILSSALRAASYVNSSKLPKEILKSSSAFLSSAPSGGKHMLPDLPYDYNALEGEDKNEPFRDKPFMLLDSI